MLMGDPLAVYTLSIGSEYVLPEVQPRADLHYICFTDRDHAAPNGWTLRRIAPLLPEDLFRSSRDPKARPHRWLGDYARSLYLDSTVHLKKDPLALWDHLMPRDEVVFGALYHSFRDTVLDEFNAVIEERLDFHKTVRAQMAAYRAHHPEALTARPVWGGMLARRHMDAGCVHAMEVWFASILRHSRRDQLSLPLALSHLPPGQTHILSADLRETEFHKWPVTSQEKPPGYRVADESLSAKFGKPLMSKRIKKLQNSLRKRGLLPGKTRAGTPRARAASVAFGHDAQLDLHFAEDVSTRKRVYVSDQKRLELYKDGVSHRRAWILGDYRVPHDLVGAGDVVVDVGANIGELGLWVEAQGGRYIAFEPDPVAFKALQNNTPDADLYDVALSDSNGTAEFYLNTAEADSSLFKPSEAHGSITVRKVTLDSFFEEVGAPEAIRLLKVEAEGMEPEVLAGALATLQKVEYVAVDAGPERGGDNTVPAVLNCLMGLGFEVVNCYLVRGTFLLRRQGV
jgi:FkbM family methyltransferase